MVEEQFSNAVITSQNNKSKSDVNTLNGGFKTGDVFEEMLKLDPEFKSRLQIKQLKLERLPIMIHLLLLY